MKQSLKTIGSFIVLLFFAILLFAFAMFQGGFVSWFLFYSYLPIAIYQLLLLFYPIRNFQVMRTMPHAVLRRGASATITVHIERKIPFPLSYCICEEIIPETLKQNNHNHDHKKIFFPGFRRKSEIELTLVNLPRGEHRLTSIRIRTGDVFGFIKKQSIFQVEDELGVYPNILDVKWIGKIRYSEEGDVAQAFFKQQGTNISGVREYVPGDRMAFIDWKQTARKNTIMTKEFEQERAEDVHLILDRSPPPGTDEDMFDIAVDLTNSLLMNMQQNLIPVHFWSIGKQAAYFSMKQERDVRKIDRYFLQVQPEETTFSTQLKKTVAGLSGTVIVITTHLDAPLQQTVEQLNNQLSGIVLLVVQSASRHAPAGDKGVLLLEKEGINVQLLASEKFMKPIEGMLG